MADSSALTPASYDQYVAGVLQDTGTLLAPAKGKAPAQAAPDASLKAQAGPYDTYIGDTLKDVDALLAPPKTGPKDSVAPEGGPMDDILGGAQGALNTVKGLFTGVAGQAAGVLDIPAHAFGISHTDPESVEQGVAGFGDLHPGTRRGERASELVQEGAGDILGAGGRAASLAARIAGKAPAGPDTSFGAGFQSRFGIPVPGVTKDNPEGIVQQSPEEQAKIEGMVNSALLPVLGGKPEARAVPLEEPLEPPPPPGSPPGGPEYTAPEVNKKTKDDDGGGGGGGAPATPKLKVRLKPKPDAAEPAPKTAEGDQVQGQPGHSPDLTRRFAGTQSSIHTPYPEGSPPGDYVMGKIRLKQGDRDVVVPVRTEFETPADEELYKVGEQVLKTWGEDKEPRPNTASPGEREILMRMRQYLAKEDPAWRQNDDRANLAYARQFAREVRDLHQRGYNVLRDHLEENFPDNPKGELRANPHKYAFSTKVPAWQPRDLVTKCF